MKRSVDYLVYVLVRLLISVIAALRIETCHWLTRPLAWLAGDVLRIRAGVLDDNLRHAFPELSDRARRALARRHWEHLFLMVVEIAQAKRKIHLTNWRQYIRFHDKRTMVRQLLSRRPTVLVSGHFGSFEVGGQVVGLFGFPTFTVARPLDNPYLDRFWNGFRSLNGQQILPKKGSADLVSRLLGSGGSLVVLGDQAAGPKGCWVDFFGRPASTHKAIALFSLSYDAPIIVTYTKRLDRPLQLEVGCAAVADPRQGEPMCAGVREMTCWFTSHLEELVRRDPEQYWWLHRRWKDYGRRRRATNKKKAA